MNYFANNRTIKTILRFLSIEHAMITSTHKTHQEHHTHEGHQYRSD